MDTSNISLTRAGWIIPTVTGSISLFASSLIISIIVRSDRNRITANYHRIIFCMSLADVVSSLAVALTTIPMPVDVNEVYNFDGIAYGTTITCDIQGVAYVFGTIFVFLTNGYLTLYYLLTIRYNVSSRVVSQFLEPCALIGSLAVSIAFPMILLKNEMINPVPFISWCNTGNYPYDCHLDEEVDCIRGREAPATTWWFLGFTLCGTLFHLISLTVIVLTVYKREKLQETASSSRQTRGDQESQEIGGAQQGQRYNEATTIAKQAIMYFAAYVTTQSFVPNLASRSNTSVTLQILSIIFKPLQGLFNAMIFIHHKVHMLRQIKADLSFYEALRILLRFPKLVPSSVILEIPQDVRPPTSLVTEELYGIKVKSSMIQSNIVLSSSDMISSNNLNISSEVSSKVMPESLSTVNKTEEKHQEAIPNLGGQCTIEL